MADGTLPAFEFRRADDKPVKPGRLVLVEWVDAYADRRGWRDTSESVGDVGDVYAVFTVGWLMAETGSSIRLCAQVHPYVSAPEEAGQVDHVQTIPRVCVRKVTPLG